MCFQTFTSTEIQKAVIVSILQIQSLRLREVNELPKVGFLQVQLRLEPSSLGSQSSQSLPLLVFSTLCFAPAFLR